MTGLVQAGGIVVRVDEARPRFLVVQARKNRAHWVFPKGHVEPGESLELAARREVREEAGVDATPVGVVGTVEFVEAGCPVSVVYWLFRYEREVGGGEGREVRWCLFEDALRLLTFDDSRTLLRDAVPLVRAAFRVESVCGRPSHDATEAPE